MHIKRNPFAFRTEYPSQLHTKTHMEQASATVTLDTCSHVLPDMQRAATEKLGAMLYASNQK